MQYIVDFFSSIGEIVETLIAFLTDFFIGLVDFFASIPEYVEIVESYIDMLPTDIAVFLTMVLAGCLVFIIIGRRGT